MSKKRSFLINIGISCIVIVAVLFTAECIMRVTWQMGGWVDRPIYQRSSNPYLRYELIPHSRTFFVEVNAAGFRGPAVRIPKPKNTFRIVMLGDSETLQILIPQEETLSAQLEKLLNSNSKGIHYEVLNFGVEGYNTFQELEQLNTKGIVYEPDLIIINYVLNDPEPGEYYLNKTFLMRHSALVRYFTYRIQKALIRRQRRRLNIKTEIDHFYYLHQPKYFRWVEASLLEMSRISKARGNKLAVVIFPTSSITVKSFKQDYPYRRLHELVKSISSHNIVFIDLLDEFNRLGLTPQDVTIDYARNESHKNARALKVSAEYIYRILSENKLIP